MITTQAATTTVAIDRAVTYISWCRAGVWGLCLGGFAMGGFIAHAEQIRSARFTVLGGLPGWPEVWGVTLMALGALALTGRMIGGRRICCRSRKVADGNDVAWAAMLGMALWYVVFASSLILGTAEYGFVPYLTIAFMHLVFGSLVRQTDGFRPSRLATS